MKFFLLYLVGSLNLALGFFVVRRLRHRPARPELGEIDLPAPTTPSEALERVKSELAAQTTFMNGQYRALEQEDLPLKELENILSEVNFASDRMLKTINAASDVLNSAGADDPNSVMLVEELEDDWSDISNCTMQLVALSFDSESDRQSQPILADACRQLQSLYEKAADQLRDRVV